MTFLTLNSQDEPDMRRMQMFDTPVPAHCCPEAFRDSWTTQCSGQQNSSNRSRVLLKRKTAELWLDWFQTDFKQTQRWAEPAAMGQRYRGAFGGVESFSRTLAVWTHRCHDTLIQPSVIDCSICVWPCRRSSANQTNRSDEGGANDNNCSGFTQNLNRFVSLWRTLIC